MTVRRVSGGFKVVSSKGKPLSKTLPSKEAADKRLRQVEYFKHVKPAGKGK